MKILFIILSLLSCLLAQDPPEEFSYNSSQLVAFYFFTDASINGDSIESDDWVAAFKGDLCVGARQWLGSYTDVPVMGDSGDEETLGYMEHGEIPSFKIYEASTGSIYDAIPTEEVAGFANGQVFFNNNYLLVETVCDNCGVCDDNPSNDCVQDCAGTWGGELELDCGGICGGSAEEDDCGVCGGDVFLEEGCDTWANCEAGWEITEGVNTYDECAAYTGEMEWSFNEIGYCDADFHCIEAGCYCWVSAYASESGCEWQGSGDPDCTGACGGSAVVDCAGECEGIAALDNCGVCNNDSSDDCILDCNGQWGGSAIIDDCGLCVEGTTGLIFNYIQDCMGDCNGILLGAGIDGFGNDCSGECGGDAVIDCAGECEGIAALDNCGVCNNDSSDDCILDCNGQWGGSAIIDDCGVCVEGTTGLIFNYIQDCEGVCGGGSVVDCYDVCGGDAIEDQCGICNGNNMQCENNIINIPDNYPTIQLGIDNAQDGDTVLVADGDYVENLVLDKSIVLASLAIYDNLDEWIIFDDYYFNQWVINNSHIENTRLIGSSPDDPDYGSVILITPDSGECISPEIVGFTIQGGSGTQVLRWDDENGNHEIDEGEEYNVVLGGGILADVSDPHIHHNAFENNGSEEVYSGGASQMTSSAEDWSFDNRNNYNPRCGVYEFRLSDNLYNGNDAQYGNTFANRFHEDDFDMSGSIFDVFDCGNEESEITSVWIKVEPAASVDYDDGAGQLCAFTASDVYVDSSIPQECLDEGCGFSNNPFKTIARTLEMINPTEDNPITIHLAAGTYSPETGESFPIDMVSNINIEGEDAEYTILDANQSDNVIEVAYSENNIIRNLTITGGYAELGAGINIMMSTLALAELIIINNTSTISGGGICIDGWSHFVITKSTITDNTAQAGGGIFYGSGGGSVYSPKSKIYNNIVWGNTPDQIELGNNFINIQYSDIEGGFIGEGNINIFPFTEINPPIIDSGIATLELNDILIENAGSLVNSICDDMSISDYASSSGNIIEGIIQGGLAASGWGGSWVGALPRFSQGPIIIYVSEDVDINDLNTSFNCLEFFEIDLDYSADFIGLAPDMGAYEFGQSSEIMAGDANFDGIVDILDIILGISIILGNADSTDEQLNALDMNQDGDANVIDIVEMINYILDN